MIKKHVYWMLEATVKEGEFDNFKELMEELLATTQANEPQTLNYEWFLSEDEKTCHIYERYADSDAVMTHLNNFQKFAQRFMAALKIKKWVTYGYPNDQVKETLRSLGSTFMQPLDGFIR